MAGHSKWKNIRLRKGKQDAIRGKLFTKLAREIIVAAKSGGGDPAINATLRVAIDKAKAASVPKDNIDRAIAKGAGGGEGTNYEEILYEGTGPGGVAFMVEVFSDNRNRTVGELRHAFTKHGGALGENGSVAWQFKQVGQISVKKSAVDEETLTLAAIDAGADEVTGDDDEYWTIETPVSALHACNDALNAAGIPTEDVEVTRLPTNMATPDASVLPKVVRLLDALEELDDVKETYINVEIPEDVYENA
ncbi:MAG: YebC/PmpR family DNA-binding transcriptional regulator [Fimbriimonadaceae bacterium]|nr:YebC/PmpR family DNA-binding transcriptional regulator [Fimbriimonadaceae bacterium]QYK56191.1 MAG: YebC/PmpR family DNA-binding transcriptional regulator [Fimbriimonadaceae bacterium]